MCLLTGLVFAAAMSCAPSGVAAPKAFGPADIARGKMFYDTNGCAACHGYDGHGDGQLAATLTPVPRDFRRADAFKGPRTIDGVAVAIARGLPAIPTAMPAFAHLDVETRQLISAYVLSLGEAPQPAQPATIVAENAWARLPAPSRDVTAVYVTLTNTATEPVRIVSGESSVADSVELHEMSMDGAMMRMRRVPEILVAAQTRLALEPGGLHVMLFGLRRSLQPGERFPLTLKLADGKAIALDVEVRAPEPRR